MLFPENIEEKLGFDRIRDRIAGLCKSARARRLVQKMRFMSSPSKLRQVLSETDQMQRLLSSTGDTPDLGQTDAFVCLKEVVVPGTFLQPDQLHHLANAMEASQQWKVFLQEHRDIAGLLHQLVAETNPDRAIVRSIRDKIDENGEIRENATPELAEVRSKLISEKVRVRKTLDRILQSARKSGNSPEDSSLTVRNGRLVIPIKAEFKRLVRGFIHDESASGSIAYIEPAEVLEINNHLKELEYREKREIVKILTALTDNVRPAIPELEQIHVTMGLIDFIHAKARYGNTTEALVPQLSNTSMLRWERAFHPLLKASLDSQQRVTVPLHIRLDDAQRIVVISGPNAGGKSVCLKTVGLLQYMVQCGLPVPIAEGSETGIFEALFIDIGDEQSIENDLSTYSSHLKNMAQLEKHCTPRTLFLIDEFGSGTDPHFGGAIAEAILEKLSESGARGVVTTHYTNLKKYAEATEGVVNGRMRFDVKNLKPLYQLEIGKPGSSFSLEIAAKTGLSGAVLTSARDRIGTDQLEIEKLLHELETEKKYYEDQASAAQQKNLLLEKTLKNYQELKDGLDSRKARLLKEAREEARDIVERTNREIENLVRSIREANAEKTHTKQKRAELEQLKNDLVQHVDRGEKGTGPVLVQGDIQPGDQVRIKGTNSVGDVLSIQKNTAVVAFGTVKSQVKLQRLEKIQSGTPHTTKTADASGSTGTFSLEKKSKSVQHELDLRGQRGEAALPAIEKFVDDAIMFSLPEVRIIHGKGEGILRQLVRDALSRHPAVHAVEDEHADRGGAGVSIVKLH